MKPFDDESSSEPVPNNDPVPLQSILLTEELNRRPSRSPDYQKENRALLALAETMADSPRAILQGLADTVLDVLQCGTAGLSLVTKDGKRFYWPAIAGAWKQHGGGTLRDFGPCCDVLDRNAPLLFTRWERRYSYLLEATPHATEALLIPFYVHGKAVGAIWAIAHDGSRKFDAEDLRQLQSLGRFGSAAYQVLEIEQMKDTGRAALNLMEDAIEARNAAHKVNMALRESEERLAAVVECSNDAIVTKDLNGIIQTWNPAAERLFGYTRQEVVGKSITIIIPADRLFEEDRILEHIRRGEHIEHYESIRRRKDGSLLNISLTISPLIGAKGNIVGASKIARDITERKLAEEEIRASEERFRMVADNMSQLAWTCDELGQVNWYNKRWLDYTGMTLEEMEGWGWTKVQHPDHRDRVVARVSRSRDTGEIWEDIFPLRGKDGKYRWFLSRAVPIRDASGRVIRWFGTNTDITERRLAETALIKAEKLAAAGRLAATLAHEINNPLQAVTNLMAILGQSQNMDSSAHEYVRMAADELGRVSRLTQQSLRFYRESNSPTAVNLEEAIESVLDLYGKRIAAKKIAVTKQYQSNGATIHSYPGEIRQVFSTLLINAMDAVPVGGRFVLRISKAADWSKPPAIDGLRVTLADSGCGIPLHHAARVFEPFFTTKGENGTGLGLWVAHGIVDRLGGSIRMRSRVHPENGGTCFSVFLPNRPPTAVS